MAGIGRLVAIPVNLTVMLPARITCRAQSMLLFSHLGSAMLPMNSCAPSSYLVPLLCRNWRPCQVCSAELLDHKLPVHCRHSSLGCTVQATHRCCEFDGAGAGQAVSNRNLHGQRACCAAVHGEGGVHAVAAGVGNGAQINGPQVHVAAVGELDRVHHQVACREQESRCTKKEARQCQPA